MKDPRVRTGMITGLVLAGTLALTAVAVPAPPPQPHRHPPEPLPAPWPQPTTVTVAVQLPAGQSTAAAALDCSVLHPVLGPLNLNLLGLAVHLNTVVLDITAIPGAGNLLCALAGLLDGGLNRPLNQLALLLNAILTALGR